MVQKMQTYDKMSTIKGHPWVPQESQVYVSRSPNVERNDKINKNKDLIIQTVTSKE